MTREERLAELRNKGGAFPLGPRARVAVSGRDSFRYLNGQLSNDLSRIPDNETMQALLLTAKGKLCAPVFVWKEGDTFLLDADPALGDDLSARIGRYIVADEVAVEDASTDDAGWHVFGCREGRLIRRLGVQGVDAAAPPAGTLQATAEEIEILRIERGIPLWGRELDGDTLPQEARLETDAVDFHKGCYVGQETVSRIKSVGRTNRILVGLAGDFPATTPGLHLSVDDTVVGKITSAAWHFELARVIALGYVKTRLEKPALSVTDANGQKLGEAVIYEFPLVSKN